MNCPRCGSQVVDGAAFCMNCGASLEESRTLLRQGAAETQRFCSRCGAELHGNDAYCGRCGSPVLAPAPPKGQGRNRRAVLAGAAAVLLLVVVAGGVLGYRAWRDARELKAHYEGGMEALRAGNHGAAVQELGWVVERSPGYEDAQAALQQAQAQMDLADLYRQAQAACEAQEWQVAIEALGQLRTQAPDYEAQNTSALLFTAESGAGLELAAQGAFAEAVLHLDRALAVTPGGDQAQGGEVERQKQLATLYPQGVADLQSGACASAVDRLAAVYGLDAAYHEVAARLYEARVCLCADLTAQGLLDQAEAQCRAAEDLGPAEQGAADGLAQIALLRTPTATPTPAASPTPSHTPTPEASPTPSSTPTPEATATAKPAAKPSCRRAAKGLIGFKRQKRCNAKTGAACGAVQIWVMNADGSKQAPMCNPQVYNQSLVRDRTSPDGAWRLDVGGRRADIVRVYSDGRQEMLIVNNRKDWDPVVSADGWWVAWVTNRNANDEIYIKTMDPKDQNQRRLTVNNWEWDKHPTWSPDGRKIAFYSNRADSLNEATRQIWVMDVVNDQGVNLRNLSNRPDMVDIDPVWFKWDGMR